MLQVKILRAVTFENFTAPSTQILLDLKILTLNDPFQLKQLSFVCESVNKISPLLFTLMTKFNLFINIVRGKLPGIIYF